MADRLRRETSKDGPVGGNSRVLTCCAAQTDERLRSIQHPKDVSAGAVRS